jgi:macrolide transport system ATP-binding/permease protein
MALIHRITNLFRRDKLDREIGQEIDAHLSMRIDDNLAQGMMPAEARRNAQLRFGNAALVRERTTEADVALYLQSIAADIRYALRQLARNPSFTATAILMMALGIGASAAIFAFVDAALIQPLPYRDPSRLLALYERIPVGDKYHLSDFDYHAWKARNHVFTSLDVYRPNTFTFTGGASAEEVSGALVSDGFFRTLGVSPALGRDFRNGEELQGAPRTALLSYESWQRRFAANRNIIGTSITLDGEPTLIVGVLPQGFHFAPTGRVEFWRTIHGLCEDQHGCFPYYGVARLKDGVSIAAAYDNLSSIAQQISQEYPKYNRDRSATVMPLTDAILGNIRPTLIALLSGAALLALIGFVNVSSLLLVRAESRRREIAVRGALGASRLRLVRQFAAEGFVLAAFGCGIGLLFTWSVMGVLARQIPANLLDNMPYLSDLHWSTHLFLFAAIISIFAAVLFSAGPALHLFFSNMQSGLKDSGRSSSNSNWRRFGRSLAAVELAITVVLLVGAGLLAKSFYRLLHVDIGIAPDHLAMLHISNPVSGSGALDDQDARNIAMERQIVTRISSLPGVAAVGVSREPAIGSGEGFTHLFAHFRVAGQPYVGEGNEAVDQTVGVGYLETLRTRLIQGRYFTEADDYSRSRVAILNRTMAAQDFPGQDVIGKQVISQYDPDHPIEIIGVIEDLKDGALDSASTAAIYSPFNQLPSSDLYLALRTTQAEASILPAVVNTVHQIDPGLIANRPETMTERIDNSESAYLHRSAAHIVTGFALLALLLGAVGLYGVISYSVSQRTREIGVRMALGAQRNSVYRLILTEAGWLAVIGVIGGILSSLGLTTFLRTMLFGVSPWDIQTLVGVTCVLFAAALLASFIPARRAASVNPVEALRSE